MIRDLVDNLTNKVNLAMHDSMTPEQESYAAGMADALEVVKEYDKSQLEIGKTYYVIVNESDGKAFHVAPMRLYKITVTSSRTTYNFKSTKGYDAVSLFSKVGIMKRVFKTLEEANEGMKTYTPFDPEFSRFRRR